jgi:aminomethyltransferase|tara:strand:- start:4395 stop:6749 length:2355 start_codon:yes stop_codon:yes gene_type:complete
MLDDVYAKVQPGPPRPSKIYLPSQFSLPAGHERYVVEGSGAILVQVEVGDQITITNDEGGQICELIATKPGIFTGIETTQADGLRALLSSNNQSLRGMRMGLDARGFDAAKATAIRLFDADTSAKANETLRAESDGAIIVAAPGVPMDHERQNTTTSLTVMIKRAIIKTRKGFELPAPIADPLQSIRIHTQTAESYFVKAGDYIQILDVDGRQCSDFECFSARKLDKGIEHALDVTTTRTLMGHAYPMPGLHAKYYDQEMLPLVEVVQDTCGRHDAFAMACSEKYYNDMGYPGHPNCSTNFNNALKDYGVASRRGWMAINFFFNTGLDEHGVMYSDEPWSRPGDYVLLRALTDIICVSSACPDDTTAANGWNPTDIHVRTYSGVEKFQRSVAYRPTPEAELKMTKQTGFHDQLAKHTRNFVEYNGYWLASGFAETGPIEEYHACRQDCVITDLSPLRKFEITGPDAEALCQYVFTRNMKTLAIGAVVYTAMCYEHGGMIDDGTLFRLDKDNFRWIGGSDYGGEWIREQAEKLGLKVLVRSSTDQLHNVAVQGPKSRDLLRNLVWTAPHNPEFDQLGWFRHTPARLHSETGTAFVLSRTGYTGELGYEVLCHPKDCEEIFGAIWETGKDYGLKPMGLDALDMVRVEAGLIFAGYDFSDQTDPFEAGIGFTVPLKSKTDDFIGRDALIRRKEHPQKKLVGLDIDSAVDVGHGDCIHVGRAQVGEVTSAIRSPLLGKNIAMARVDVAYAAAGTALEIGKLDGHQKRLPAEVRPDLAAYDPTKERPRS